MNNTKSFTKTVAAAAALAFTAIVASSAYANMGTNHMVKCEGVNSCKGHGQCKTSMNACKGMNSCKGKGVMEMSEADCKAKGGKMIKDHMNQNNQ